MNLSSFKFSRWAPKDEDACVLCVMTLLGHLMSLILAPIESAYATSYWSSIVTLVLSCPVSLQVSWEVQPHPPFRFVPKSTTLDDLERPIRRIRTLLQKRCIFRSPPQKIEWRYTHIISSKYVGIDSSFWRHKVMQIFAGGLWRGGAKRQWGNRKRRFSGLLDATSSAP